MKKLTQPELLDFAQKVVDTTRAEMKEKLTDLITIKYLERIENLVQKLKETRKNISDNARNTQILEADKKRDRAISVFRRQMQVYELSEDLSPEALAYEELNQLWTTKYDSLPYLSYAVETAGIDDLLFVLSAERYIKNIETLGLLESLEKIRTTNEEFKKIYPLNDESSEALKSTYDVRKLNLDLENTLQQYDHYIAALSKTELLSSNDEMVALRRIFDKIQSQSAEIVSTRRTGINIFKTLLNE